MHALMRLTVFLGFCVVFSLSCSVPVRAADWGGDTSPRDPNRLILSAGMYDITDSSSEHRYPTYTAELRLSQIPVWKFHPWLGFEYEHNTILDQTLDSYWLGGGLETDIDLTDRLVLTLQTGLGYFDAGNNVPYGWQYLPNDGLEFRHQIELSTRFGNGYRAGIGITHMSNAGIRANNDPINSAVLNLHVPLTWPGSAE
jgi:hypothetical protein